MYSAREVLASLEWTPLFASRRFKPAANQPDPLFSPQPTQSAPLAYGEGKQTPFLGLQG